MPRNPTPAQSNASRRNGARSPGPKTPEGKSAVRYNAVKHGLAAETVILPGENSAGFDQLLQDLIDRIQPVGNVEVEFVRDWAQTRWRLQRCVLMERNSLFYRMQLQEPELDIQWDKPDMALRSAAAHAHELSKGAVKNLSIYESRLRRALRAIQKDLIEFRKNFPVPDPVTQIRTNKPEPSLTLVESTASQPPAPPEPRPLLALRPVAGVAPKPVPPTAPTLTLPEVLIAPRAA